MTQNEIGTNLNEIRQLLGIKENTTADVLDHNLYGIHIKLQNDALSDTNPHICIGWSAMGDLSNVTTKDELVAKYDATWPNEKAKKRGQGIGQVWRFAKEMKVGDYVVFANGDICHIGRITSDYYFDNTTRVNQDADYTNIRNVEWLKKDIRKSDLSQAFKNSLGAAMSVFGLNDYKSVVYDLLNDTYKKDEELLDEHEVRGIVDDTIISEEDFRQWLSKRTKKNGELLSKESQNSYYYMLKALPSMLGVKDVFAITSYNEFTMYKTNVVAMDTYEEANPNIGSGTLSAALTQYDYYLAERNGISIPEDRLAQILKDWYTRKYVENNITSTLVGYGFKYACAINMAKVSSKALLDLAKIESTMAAYIDRGKDLYAAMEKASIGFKIENEQNCLENAVIPFDYSTIKGRSINKIFYGVPGCGKSHHIQKNILAAEGYEEKNIIRTTFYQDYSNTDFVGQILPKIVKGANGDKDIVEYIFNPGPFTLAFIQAISNPTKKVALVIEEINRGNAPAIFGDIFQLLDRDDNSISEYGIVNVGMLDYLNAYEFDVDGEKKRYIFKDIKIPANMDIFATMNTSDQNVYTLDTAFTRRWDKERIPNSFNGNDIANFFVPGMEPYTWGMFVNAINEQIKNKLDDLQVNEDKQVGAFFVKKSDLLASGNALSAEDKKAKVISFAHKVLEYLWDDVSKLDHSVIFNSTYTTFEKVATDYLEKGIVVFNSEIFKDKLTQAEEAN